MDQGFDQLRVQMTPWLLLLQKYYQGHLCKLDDGQWDTLLQALEAEPLERLPRIKEGLELLLQAEPARRADMKYDFNRLFIGPDALLAPPYESCYRNPEKTLMQAETLRVRAFYLKAGLEISQKNVEPDDFIAFELEFLLFLLGEGSGEKDALAREFLELHLLAWYAGHVQAIRAGTDHPICLGLAAVLEGVMEEFRDFLSSAPQS